MQKIVFIIMAILLTTTYSTTGTTAANISNIEVGKQWTIKFSKSIDASSVAGNVYITDGSKKLNVNVTTNNNVLTVKPLTTLEFNHPYTLVVTDNLKDPNGLAVHEAVEIPFIMTGEKMATPAQIYKIFKSEYNMTWTQPSDNYKQFYLIGLKDGQTVGGHETRQGEVVFGVTVGASHSSVKAKYGEPLPRISKFNTNYNQSYVDQYGNETSGTYLIDGHYVTFFYDAHKNNIVRSVTWVTKKTENSKTGFFATPSSSLRTGLEDLMAELINETRVANGLNALTYTADFNQTARKHSVSMAENNYFSHVDLNGLRGGDRLKNGGISNSRWGENLAYGQYSAIYAHEALMNSLSHRKNILRSDFTHIFVGVAFNSVGAPYYTINFYRK